MIWAALALNQKGTRACPWEAPPEQHIGELCSLRPEVLVGNTHKNAMLFTSSVGPVVIFFANGALSPQKCRCINLPLPTNTGILAICVFLIRCGLTVFNGPFFPPGSVPTVCFSLSCSLQQPPCACPSTLPVCQTALPQATKPCNTALLHPREGISSAARQTELRPFLGISSVRWEGLMQKAALTRKSRPCQSVPIREPLLSGALRHTSASVNN